MAEEQIPTRAEALDALERHGITGAQVYLIDLLPLIEMAWADGKVEETELNVLDGYLRKHVAHINDLAGYEIFSVGAAYAFLHRFLEERPDPELMRTLRTFIHPLRMATSDDTANRSLRDSLLAACLDMGACSITDGPDGPAGFRMPEKLCFFEILESMEEGRGRGD